MSELKTRKLSGKPSWPLLLLAGAEKVGKSWSAVAASSSDLIGHTLWFPLGEDDPDEYAQIPGFDADRFDLVEHDGSYRGLMDALQAAANFQDRGGKPTLWVLDSASRLWDLLSGMAQVESNQRWARKHGSQLPDDDIRPTVDLWNTATDRWYYILDEFRAHHGPVIWTARMESTTVMDSRGEPTREKVQKILAQKRLPNDAGAIIEMPSRGEVYLTGLRSVKFPFLDQRVPMPEFTVDGLWRKLGLDEAVGHRTQTLIDPEDKPMLAADKARAELVALIQENGWDGKAIAAEYLDRSDGVPITDERSAPAIRAFTKWVKDNWAKRTETAA